MATARKTPIASEATDGTVAVTFGGESLDILVTAKWPLDALEAYEEGKIVAFLKLIIAADGWARLKALKPEVGDLAELVTDIQKALGIQGN
jgi:hypothetical protein